MTRLYSASLKLLMFSLIVVMIGCDGQDVAWTPCDSTLSRSEEARVMRASQRDAIEAAQLWIELVGENASVGDASGIGQFFVVGGRLEDGLPYLKRVAHSDCQYDRGYHLLLIAETYFDLGRVEEARSYVELTREFLRSDQVDRGEALAPAGAQTSHLVRDGVKGLEERIDELEWERHRQSSSSN